MKNEMNMKWASVVGKNQLRCVSADFGGVLTFSEIFCDQFTQPYLHNADSYYSFISRFMIQFFINFSNQSINKQRN